MESELKDAKDLQEGDEQEYEQFKKIIANLKSENGELKEKIEPLVAQIRSLLIELDEARNLYQHSQNDLNKLKQNQSNKVNEHPSTTSLQ